MAASFYVNTLQVKLESVLVMEHTGMARMFKSLVETGLEGFLAVSDSVYKAAVVEFFVNANRCQRFALTNLAALLVFDAGAEICLTGATSFCFK
ncbi:OBERON-like protein-like [Dorcoceras hygrometricum]|uniref:OBERON-like protein-like n=1 Tax=Dorcoceras hygrometricum TaxID=472368 RepID=A0A2Z7B4Q2_9LAMI|nr:OBERON-like protein-like [Dorcoceras hygrometricum]